MVDQSPRTVAAGQDGAHTGWQVPCGRNRKRRQVQRGEQGSLAPRRGLPRRTATCARAVHAILPIQWRHVEMLHIQNLPCRRNHHRCNSWLPLGQSPYRPVRGCKIKQILIIIMYSIHAIYIYQSCQSSFWLGMQCRTGRHSDIGRQGRNLEFWPGCR